MKTQSNTVAVLCLVAGIAIFSVQDLILKQLSGAYPLHQAMVLRSLTAVPFMLLITWWFDGSLATLVNRNWPAMLGRGLLNFAAYTAYYLALAALPFSFSLLSACGDNAAERAAEQEADRVEDQIETQADGFQPIGLAERD